MKYAYIFATHVHHKSPLHSTKHVICNCKDYKTKRQLRKVKYQRRNNASSKKLCFLLCDDYDWKWGDVNKFPNDFTIFSYSSCVNLNCHF